MVSLLCLFYLFLDSGKLLSGDDDILIIKDIWQLVDILLNGLYI